MKPTYLLVDGNNLLARADFAARGGRVEMSVDGVNTASLMIFINLLSKHVRRIQPTHLAVMWDAGHAFRDALFPAYKAKRKQPPSGEGEPDPTLPMSQAKEFLTWANVPHKACKGYEADDLIAATARQCDDAEVAILSGDKDLLQLLREARDPLDGSVVQYKVPDDTLWTVERYTEAYGYAPEKAALVHALVGDVSDGVPGLRGIGPKKAVKLLQEAGWDWEALLDLLGPEKAITASVMRSLVDLRDYPYDEVFLAANRGVPPFMPSRGEGDMLWPALAGFCEKYRLNTVLDRVRSGTLWTEPSSAQSAPEGLFDNVDIA